MEVSVNLIWILLSAFLVFLMQAGFMCLEAGLTQKKNNINVAAKNLVDLGIAIVLFWACGYALMFGKTLFGVIGWGDFFVEFINNTNRPTESQLGTVAFFLFQVVFCTTAVTIISGASAERMRFTGYIIVSIFVSGLIYPIYGHWAWYDEGWLKVLGFVDFAGSTVVHSVGGWAALAVLMIIGPRQGRFVKDENGKRQTNTLSQANLPMATLGTFLLWFGWFGFNGGSLLLLTEKSELVAPVIANTLLAGAAGLCAVAAIQFRQGAFKVDMLMNGGLAGLVCITASSNQATAFEAFMFGIIGAGTMWLLNDWLLQKGIDDAVGAVPVHLGAGVVGTFLVAFAGADEFVNPEQLKSQLWGIVACAVWAFGGTGAFLYAFTRGKKNVYKVRVKPEEEKEGLNKVEHQAEPDYSDFPIQNFLD